MFEESIETTRAHQKFFSIKWKIMLVMCAFTIGVNSVLIFVNYRNQHQQFEDQLLDDIAAQSQSFLNQARHRLLELATAMSMYGYESEYDSIELDKLTVYLHRNWEILQLDWGLENIGFYDNTGHVIATDVSTIVSPERFTGQIEKVFTNYEPVTRVYCESYCELFAFIPLLLHDGSHIVMVVSSLLTDYLLDFSRKNKLDIALLSQEKQNTRTRSLEPWPLSILAITRSSHNLPLMRKFANQVFFEDFLDKGGDFYKDEKLQFYINVIQLGNNQKTQKHFIIVINDVTDQAKRIFKNTLLSLLISGLGVVMSIVILFFVLHRPLLHLRKEALLLPLLASTATSRFEAVRLGLSVKNDQNKYYNELDILDDTAVNLANQLEAMEGKILQRTDALEKMALSDALTGLLNRRAFINHLEHLVEQYQRHHRPFSVIFIDLDNFKTVNDNMGHDVGDQLLVDVSERLTSNVRKTDLVARLGGDEFILLLTDVGDLEKQVIPVVNKLLKALQINVKSESSDLEVLVSPSIGVVLMDGDHLDVDDLMRRADMAMYEAKKKGKNGYQFYSSCLSSGNDL